MTNNNEQPMAIDTTLFDAVKSLIEGKYIVYYGVVQEILADGVVMVSTSVIKGVEDYIAVPCVLGTIASDSFALNVKPKVKDKVLVFCPRLYDNSMFEKDKYGSILNAKAYGYSPYAGIAFLVNQYQTATHKNQVTIDNGAIEAHLSYDASSDKHNIEFNTNSDGDFTFKNPAVTLEAKKDGVIEVKNANASIKVDSNGDVTIDSKGGYTIKNTTTSLKTVLDQLVTILSALGTIDSSGSFPPQVINPATVTALQNWQTSLVDMLLKA